MSFLKKLFGKKDELEPLILQAIENLYQNEADQQQAIEFSRRYLNYQTSKDNVLLLFGLLSYSEGDIEKLLATEQGAICNYQFMIDQIGWRFRNKKAAEEWVMSLSNPQD